MIIIDQTALEAMKQIVKAFEENGKFTNNGRVKLKFFDFFKNVNVRALEIMNDIQVKTLRK